MGDRFVRAEASQDRRPSERLMPSRAKWLHHFGSVTLHRYRRSGTDFYRKEGRNFVASTNKCRNRELSSFLASLLVLSLASSSRLAMIARALARRLLLTMRVDLASSASSRSPGETSSLADFRKSESAVQKSRIFVLTRDLARRVASRRLIMQRVGGADPTCEVNEVNRGRAFSSTCDCAIAMRRWIIPRELPRWRSFSRRSSDARLSGYHERTRSRAATRSHDRFTSANRIIRELYTGSKSRAV